MRFLKRTRGFSLLELLLVLALSAFLAVLAFPSLTHFGAQAKSEVLETALMTALQEARREALLLHLPVTLCKSKDQETCTGAWQEGFIIFVDLEQDATVHDPAQILYRFKMLRQQGVLQWRGFPQNKAALQFLPSGALNHENGTFWFCSAKVALPIWAVVVSQSGRARFVKALSPALSRW